MKPNPLRNVLRHLELCSGFIESWGKVPYQHLGSLTVGHIKWGVATSILFASVFSTSLIAAPDSQKELQMEVKRLQAQTIQLQNKLNHIQKSLVKEAHVKDLKSAKKGKKGAAKQKPVKPTEASTNYHKSTVVVHQPDNDPESLDFYPTALIADQHVVTYIAGTPVVSSPYLGSRPAFDGSDYIVNIASINRDIRLMQQRRSLYRAYDKIGYQAPNTPIIALSGKLEPVATFGDPFKGGANGDLTLGSNELDVAAILNSSVEGYMSVVYDSSPPDVGGQRLSNSALGLNMGFVNIGNLDKTPFYFTAGQIFVPFGRYSTAMVSAPLTTVMSRTKARPFILGYKSQTDTGPIAAIYGFRSDTTLGNGAAGGVNLGYIYDATYFNGEIGGSFISSMDDAGGMQFTGAAPGTTFGGFSSITNGSEMVKKIPAVGVHGTLHVDRFNFTAEWIGATTAFRPEDLSFNGRGARPQALQLEGGMTFRNFDKPASIALGYQWSQDTLALNLPNRRIAGVYNISIWKDTVESLEYRHDINFRKNQYANGASAPDYTNANTISPGGSTDTLLAQIAVYF